MYDLIMYELIVFWKIMKLACVLKEDDLFYIMTIRIKLNGSTV